MTRVLLRLTLIIGLVFTGILSCSKNTAKVMSDKNIVAAYEYYLGRLLVLRQEHLDFRDGGFAWNRIFHRPVGGVTWANPNLDVAYSEAWLAIDPTSCALVDIPIIKGRYYTFQVLNSWGETVSNINERTLPKHPNGKFAYCTKDSKVSLPRGTEKIELEGHKFRVLARVELGANPQTAIRLQKQIKVSATGKPNIAPAVNFPLFSNKELPGVAVFDPAIEILQSEPDINRDMSSLQDKVIAISKAVRDPSERKKVDEVIHKKAIPAFFKALQTAGSNQNGWTRPSTTGNYGSDYLSRSLANFAGIWANNNDEVVYFKTNTDGDGKPLDGSTVYTMTFPKGQLPQSLVRYFWSVVAVDSGEFKVINNPLKKYVINNQTRTRLNPDGSMTLVFADKLPAGVARANWLPTPAKENYNLTFRFYGPKEAVRNGSYFPPPLVKKTTEQLAQNHD